jgi:hypothetical protein
MNLKQEIVRDGLESLGRYYGIYHGTVLDNADPKKLGRLKVSVPAVYGDQEHDYWANSKGLFAGQGYGSMMLPTVGSPVWVSFINGDCRYPVWEYGWWGENDQIEGLNNYPEVFTLRTPAGNLIEIDDKAKTLQISLTDGSGLQISPSSISIVRKGRTINLGQENGSDEPAVKGDSNAEVLEDILNQLNTLTQAVQQLSGAFVPNPAGATIIPAVTAQLAQILIDNIVTTGKVPFTKSSIVSLD